MSRLLKIAKQPNYASNPSNQNVRAFDKNSGQVFTETISTGGCMTTDWVWKTIGSSSNARGFRSRGLGCTSLKDMAIRSAIVHSRSITPESLQEVPWTVGEQLWRKIVSSQLISVRIWTVFATAYTGVPEESLKTKHHIILEPNTAFFNYISPLISDCFHWITSLTLSNVSCTRTDLVQLSKLCNLGVLTIGSGVMCPEAGLDDSIIRAWGRAATESDAFSMLRVLVCRSQREITTRSFSYLNSLPSLAFFNVEDCNIGPQDKIQASNAGWKYLVGKKLNELLAKNGTQCYSWGLIVQSFFNGGGDYSIEELSAEGIDAISALPFLHCSIGAAPPDAVVDVRGNKGMKSFQRIKKRIATSTIPTNDLKRSYEDSPQLVNLSRKKPAMRTSKQQSMEQLLAEFG